MNPKSFFHVYFWLSRILISKIVLRNRTILFRFPSETSPKSRKFCSIATPGHSKSREHGSGAVRFKRLRDTIDNQHCQSTINNQQSTTNNQQPTINNPQSTINNQKSTNSIVRKPFELIFWESVATLWYIQHFSRSWGQTASWRPTSSDLEDFSDLRFPP